MSPLIIIWAALIATVVSVAGQATETTTVSSSGGGVGGLCQDRPRLGSFNETELSQPCNNISETVCWYQVEPRPASGNNRIFYRCSRRTDGSIRWTPFQCPIFQQCSLTTNVFGCACAR